MVYYFKVYVKDDKKFDFFPDLNFCLSSIIFFIRSCCLVSFSDNWPTKTFCRFGTGSTKNKIYYFEIMLIIIYNFLMVHNQLKINKKSFY